MSITDSKIEITSNKYILINEKYNWNEYNEKNK